ncbi:MAG: LamG domain-containing protein [Bacilli bacterium]|nr:LamG domain-containing protein [Bacilli bacterium]
MIKNNKGFIITEVLILATVLIGVLIFMYSQFKNITRSYEYSFKYDTVEGMYLANNIINYINQGSYDILVQTLNNSEQDYLDIYSDINDRIVGCDINIFETPIFCSDLFKLSQVERVIFAKEDLKELKNNMKELPEDLKDYINNIKVLNSFNDYRIIVKYKNGTFSTMRFNKGNIYVPNDLIVYLDAVNNTGNGHSNQTTEWRDLSGNNHNVTLYNNPIWHDNSLIFDGVTNYGLISSTANIEFKKGTTWEVRVKMLSLTGAYDNGINTSAEFFGNWEGAGGGFMLSTDNKFYSNIYINDSYNTIEFDRAANLNNYYTLTMTYDNNIRKIYLNGVLLSTTEITPSTYIKPSTAPFALGGNPYISGVNGYANVEFQSVRIYDRALTDEEVAKNYQADIFRFGGE